MFVRGGVYRVVEALAERGKVLGSALMFDYVLPGHQRRVAANIWSRTKRIIRLRSHSDSFHVNGTAAAVASRSRFILGEISRRAESSARRCGYAAHHIMVNRSDSWCFYTLYARSGWHLPPAPLPQT